LLALSRSPQALLKCSPLLERPESEAGDGTDSEPLPVWVLTRGSGVGAVSASQGSIQGFVTVMCSELPVITAKHLDLASASDLGAGLGLIVDGARERAFAVEAGRVVVPRIHAVDREEIKHTEVLPSGDQSFFVDPALSVVQQGHPVPLGHISAYFRLRDLPPPGDDEVTVEVHAASLNFRVSGLR
jgi:hypothetical protein